MLTEIAPCPTCGTIWKVPGTEPFRLGDRVRHRFDMTEIPGTIVKVERRRRSSIGDVLIAATKYHVAWDQPADVHTPYFTADVLELTGA